MSMSDPEVETPPRDPSHRPSPPPAAERRLPPPPARLPTVNWDDLRRKGWAMALTLATAYVATKPDRWGWIAPVLTAAAAGSKPPTVTYRALPEPPK